MKKLLFTAMALSAVLALSACSGGGGSSAASNPSAWTWMSGSNTAAQSGVYGTKGAASAANVPGARGYFVSWKDGSGNLWLLGGNGYDSAGTQGDLNDLWKFDGTDWTWVNGSNTVNQNGVYGTKGVASASNVPGARNSPASWKDGAGNLCIFGGSGYDSTGTQGRLNDLWKFDGTTWVWVSGSDTVNQAGVYGTKGVASASNVPGARYFYGSATWVDNSGNLWFFGGVGYDSAGTQGNLNDLWKFDGTDWTWVSGSDTVNQNGVYGTKGIASASNVPGARWGSVTWRDGNGNLWLFGGYGYDSTGAQDDLNDVWKFDGSNWTWVSGSATVAQAGVYGTKGAASASNVPGARDSSASWTDTSGNLWLLGGNGYDSAGTNDYLNDLWKFDGAKWTWVSGSDTVNQAGIYGTKGAASASNVPGARDYAASWVDNNGNLWLFGGVGHDSTGVTDRLNDLWRYNLR
jgi:N-acetylneuraminic acid mutarotase